jgi:hypothetical protein
MTMMRLALALVLAACSREHAHIDETANPDGAALDTVLVGDDTSTELEPLLPLTIGDRSQSTQTSSGDGTPTTTCDVTQTVTGQMMVDGRDAFVIVVDAVCPARSNSSSYYIATSGGDHYESRTSTATDGIWYVIDPPAEGHQWASDPAGMYVFTWHRVSSITVPAGTFTDCWRTVTGIGGSDQEATYCRGVGVVAIDDSFTTGYMVHGELVAKNF